MRRKSCGASADFRATVLLVVLSTGLVSGRAAHADAPTRPLLVWANDGGEKIPQEDLRRAQGTPTKNAVWDEKGVRLAGAGNEVLGFNLVLEAPSGAGGVSVAFSRLESPRGSIDSKPAGKEELFDFVGRNIELFYIRYLPIRGLSRVHYDVYDERHVPLKLRRPFDGDGHGTGGWKDRPDHGKSYPDICVPLELNPSFAIAPGQNQSVWVDIYIPKTAPPGTYQGKIEIRGKDIAAQEIPVTLEVKAFALPDTPAAKTMVYFGYKDVNQRYTGVDWPGPGSPAALRAGLVRDRHFLLAHRHKITLFDADDGPGPWDRDEPRPAWLPRLDGSLFTAQHGYDGPGVGLPAGFYVIGAYGQAAWQAKPEAYKHQDGWVSWFRQNFPAAEHFIYLSDESAQLAVTEQLAAAFRQDPGVGGGLGTFATLPLDKGVQQVPSLGIYGSTLAVADTMSWQAAADKIHGLGKQVFLYNGMRPASGSFATEDDGVSPRELAWGQYKKRVDRWFVWESTYYDNYQGGTGQTNVFEQAKTFGAKPEPDPILGERSWNYGNGDGVLFYPGTDRAFPGESYEVAGPFASLRLKLWRRGIQDVDYLALAAKVDPARVAKLVGRMVPKVLWEVGVADPKDPTWQRTDISWPSGPDAWEAARRELMEIIERKNPR